MVRLLSFAFLIPALAFPVQQDEILHKKNGELVRGKPTRFDDKGIMMKLSPNSEVFFPYEQLNPVSAYELRRKYMDKESFDQHLSLARFCRRFELYRDAVNHLQEALRRAPEERKEELEAEINEVRSEDAGKKVKRAKEILSNQEARRYAEASRLLREVMDKYADTPYFEEAKALDLKLAEAIKETSKNPPRKEPEKAPEVPSGERPKPDELAARISATFEEVEKLWHQGLDQETQATQPDRAFVPWTQAEGRLVDLKSVVQHKIKEKGNADPATEPALKQIDQWLIRLYLSMARLRLELVQPAEALKNCNKGIKLSPDHPHLNQLKVAITEILLRIKMERQFPGR